MAWYVCWIALLLAVAAGEMNGGNVTYDGRSLIIDGQRKILFSGSIHYPRSTPDMWPSLISKAKEGGIDVIQTYVFWNLHETQPGQYDFSGRNDIVSFIKEIQAQGLYASLRIGPFIEAEWTYGGFPFWLHDIPDIVYRSDNEPFKQRMENFTTKIVNMMKSEGLYASQGGPIILSQIENEYQNIEPAFHEKGPPYVRWAAEMAVGLQTGVPWMMCKQDDAPDPVINTCNGKRCGETFVGPNSPNKPSLWTENWTSYYQVYGDNTTLRSAEDIAYHVALFIAQKNGSFINYYMYHGGTNFGRTGSAYVLTSYYDQAPLDEYGLIRQPKWGHLKELHAAVKLCSETLLSGFPTTQSLGPQQNAYVFQGKSSECASFLANMNGKKEVSVKFQNSMYQLPPRSISILPDCKTVAFNTAKVDTQSNTRSIVPSLKFDSADKWEVFEEAVPRFDETTLRSNILLEQMNTTKDSSDYLWYTIRVEHNSSDAQSVLQVNSLAHVLHAFVNQTLIGSAHGTKKNTNFTLEYNVSLINGMNDISLLSIMVGLPDSGPFLERKIAGVRSVRIQSNQQTEDYTNYTWGYQVGLWGEKLKIYTEEGYGNVQWNSFKSSQQPLSWYKMRKRSEGRESFYADIFIRHKQLTCRCGDHSLVGTGFGREPHIVTNTWSRYQTVFDAPEGNEPLALNLSPMGKGEAWVNGQSIGRYWISFRTSDGSPSQTWYHVPRSFLKPTGNLLVLLDEEYGNPLDITLDTVSITGLPRKDEMRHHSVTPKFW